MTFRTADIAVGATAIFITGALVGMWLEPDTKPAACTNVPSKMEYPRTKAEVQRFVKSYHNQGKGYIK
jgi:hypothetical protein